VSQPTPFSFLLPGLLAGIPALLVLIIVLLQIAGGVAWLPFVKRWLGGTGVPTPSQRRGP
jgi:hypothetical protein